MSAACHSGGLDAARYHARDAAMREALGNAACLCARAAAAAVDAEGGRAPGKPVAMAPSKPTPGSHAQQASGPKPPFAAKAFACPAALRLSAAVESNRRARKMAERRVAPAFAPAVTAAAAGATTDAVLRTTTAGASRAVPGGFRRGQKILLVGEGNFSFALALALGLGSGDSIVATGKDVLGRVRVWLRARQGGGQGRGQGGRGASCAGKGVWPGCETMLLPPPPRAGLSSGFPCGRVRQFELLLRYVVWPLPQRSTRFERLETSTRQRSKPTLRCCSGSAAGRCSAWTQAAWRPTRPWPALCWRHKLEKHRPVLGCRPSIA